MISMTQNKNLVDLTKKILDGKNPRRDQKTNNLKIP